MAALWSDQNRYRIWLEVELAAMDAMAKHGLVPQSAADEIRAKAKIDPERIDAIEAQVKHDVIAFLTSISESVGEQGRFLHRGMTSSDVVDTGFALMLLRSARIILGSLDKSHAAVWQLAIKYKNVSCIARTHGIHAEPTTLGLKFASWAAELSRQRVRICAAMREISCGKISGAVGTNSEVSPQIEAEILEKLGLRPETVATQVVARDRHAQFFLALASLGASIERFAVEIRHLQRTEVGELEEPFGAGQKGSSAMPHKRNPILSENLCGLARMLRSYMVPALENVALWHERDISHSAAERVIGPDACTLTHFMLERFLQIVSGLSVNLDRVQANLEMTRGLIFSGAVLVSLTEHGMSREEAYLIVQRHAHAAIQGGPDFVERINSDAQIVKALGKQKIKELCSFERSKLHIEEIFKRAEEYNRAVESQI